MIPNGTRPILIILTVAVIWVFSEPALLSDSSGSRSSNDAVSVAHEPLTFLNEAYSALRTKFSIGAPLAPVRLGDGDIRAFQRFGVTCPATPTIDRACDWCREAVVSMEVHQNGSDLSVWVAVPHHGLDVCDEPASYLWYEYVKEGDEFLVISHPLLEIPPFPAPDIPDDQLYRLYNAWRWSHNGIYGGTFPEFLSRVDPSADPPHWSSILNGMNERERDRYVALHLGMQHSSTQAEAMRILDLAAPSSRVDLTNRAMYLWTPVTLRGLVRSAGVSSTDLKRDHAGDYHDGADVITGSILAGASSDTSSPAQDYDMRVIPDPDVHYLGSWGRGIPGLPDAVEPGLFDLNVEIEQFALGMPRSRSFAANPYRPLTGEWAQIIGRWVIDCGHGATVGEIAEASSVYERLMHARIRRDGPARLISVEHYTEIHPPELMVPVTYPTTNMAQARVIATGAWAGEDLTFFVTPPPRPTINARLRYRIRKADGTDGFDAQLGSTLELIPWPASNSNHLVGVIRSTDHDWILLYETGLVGMTRRRKIRGIVECWWETPSASLSGRITGSGDLSDSVIYYRNADIPDASWSLLPVNSFGRFRLDHLELGTYWFRPASPNRDFAGVPRRVTTREGTNDLEPFVARDRTPSIEELGALHSDPDLPPYIYGELTRQLLTYDSHPSTMGVQRNELRYPENGTLLVHLAGLVRSETDPSAVASLDEAFCDTERGGGLPCVPIDRRFREAYGLPRYLTLGTSGHGVEAATFVVKLLVHINGRTYVADKKTLQTAEGGGVSLHFHTGSHVEEVSFAIEATDNPFNRWFLPSAQTSDRIKVYPGASGDDFGRQFYPGFDRPVAAIMGLSELLIPPGKLSPLPRKDQLRLKLSAIEASLVAKVNKKRKEDSEFSPKSMQSILTKQKIKKAASNAQMAKNFRLPKRIEDAWRLVRDKKFRGRLGDPLPKFKSERIHQQPTPTTTPEKRKIRPPERPPPQVN